jgi:hypothetical protein
MPHQLDQMHIIKVIGMQGMHIEMEVMMTFAALTILILTASIINWAIV